VYASGGDLRIVGFEFAAERLTWRVQNPGAETEMLLSVGFHPYWKASLDGSPVALRETPDHLMLATVPPGTHELAIVFRRPGWRKGLDVASASAGLACLAWAAQAALRERRLAAARALPAH
jgi:hypothetical protein